MSHISSKASYKNLVERLNRSPQGAPASDTLYKILTILFSEKEAALVAQLPIKLFTARKAAAIWGMSENDAEKILGGLASRCILLDMESSGKTRYMLPPPMAGFLEFSMMRTRNDIDQQLLAELFYQYMNVEENFIKELFFSTGCGRLEWWCLDWNKPSVDFYLSLGADQMSDWIVYRIAGNALKDLAGE